jgi:hypothetical protein
MGLRLKSDILAGKHHPTAFISAVMKMQDFPEVVKSRDVFPLPVASVTDEELVWSQRQKGSSVEAKALAFPDSVLERAAAVKAWLWLMVFGLSSLFEKGPFFVAGRSAISVGPPSLAQVACLNHLEKLTVAFCENAVEIPSFSWPVFFKTFKMSYNAEIVDVAHPISWSCIKPALPNKDMIAGVDLLDV